MRKIIPGLNRQILNSSLAVLFFALSINSYGQTPPPTGDPNPFFCSKASWTAGGFSAMPGDVLGDLQVYGENLQWYADQALNSPLPPATTMADGKTYYVTQTVGGSESAPLAVNVMDRTCGCIKEPDFEEQDGTTALEGYDFYHQPEDPYHKVCGAVLTPPAAGGTTVVTVSNANLDDAGHNAAPVSPGIDGEVPGLPTVSPFNANSQRAIKVGKTGNSQLIYMTKEFVAGEVLSFNFALVLNNPGHEPSAQPFYQVQVYDKNDNVVASRCIISIDTDCVFLPEGSTILYTEWSCIKLNTLDIQGEYARMEMVVAGCSQTTHYGYGYVDDIYVGPDANSPCNTISFGYMAVDSIEPDQASGSCYVTQSGGSNAACSTGLSESLPFPITVCGVYEEPISNGPPPTFSNTDLVLDILHNGVVVGTLNNATIDRNAKTFCFTLDDTDVNVSPPYGEFTFEANIDFGLNCGAAYDILIDDRSSVQICPPAGCAAPIVVCDDTGTGIGTFDLTSAAPTIRNGFTATDVDLSYYETEADAYAETNEITNPQSYSNTNSPDSQTIYVRLDWNMTAQGCTYLVKLELQVNVAPQFDFPTDTIVGCGANIDIPLVATPDNLAEMNNVNYAWYLDGVRLPHFGSVYHATAPGTYEVTVSNDVSCEVTRSIVVEQANFSVSLADDAVICGVDRTLTAAITDNGSTPAIDPSLATYAWNTGATTSSIDVTESGDYSVEVTYKGCTETASVTVVARPEVSLGADFKMCVDDEMELTANTDLEGGSLEYIWYRDGGVISGETGSTLTIMDPGTYRVEVNEVGGAFCAGEDQIVVGIYDNENCIIPQGISPNGDQYNQSLDLTFLNDRSGISGIEIFNRHGRSVYSKTGGYTNEWQGQSSEGDELVTGTYYYVIKLETTDAVLNKQVLTGWIYINREIQ